MGKVVRAVTPVKKAPPTDAHPVVLASGDEAVAGIAELLQGLSPNQRAFLRLRYYYESDAECAREIGVKADR